MKLDSSIAAIVTGGASGLGEGTARRLAADGAKVAIFDMNAERGEMVAKEIGGVFCQVNVSDEASIDAGLAKAREAHGQERVFVNCAGIGWAAYAASKGGIYGMTLPMARDLAKEGIRVNTILPGFFETPIYQQMPPEVKVSLASHLQFPQRFGTPEEYADLVAFMVNSDYINAECVRLDAGARMPPK